MSERARWAKEQRRRCRERIRRDHSGEAVGEGRSTEGLNTQTSSAEVTARYVCRSGGYCKISRKRRKRVERKMIRRLHWQGNDVGVFFFLEMTGRQKNGSVKRSFGARSAGASLSNTHTSRYRHIAAIRFRRCVADPHSSQLTTLRSRHRSTRSARHAGRARARARARGVNGGPRARAASRVLLCHRSARPQEWRLDDAIRFYRQ